MTPISNVSSHPLHDQTSGGGALPKHRFWNANIFPLPAFIYPQSQNSGDNETTDEKT